MRFLFFKEESPISRYITAILGFQVSVDKYKIMLPEANGTGAIGEVLSTPLIGATDTFISIGPFEDKVTAENVLKYIKTKFARTMLGVKKVTQHNPRATWVKVPM